MGVTVEMEADDLRCRCEASAIAAAKLIQEDRSVYNLVQELTARIKQPR